MKSIIATAALVATTAASKLSVRAENYNRNASCETTLPYAKVVNRCSYPVYLWSIAQEDGCPADKGVELKTGDFYYENYVTEFTGGVSIKLSKSETCGAKDLTQLEYKIQTTGDYKGNYLDMSFVNCIGNLEDCPGRTDGFYLKSGNEGGIHVSEVDNEHCPIFNVYDSVEAAAVSYIKWDDRQTKFCSEKANLQLFLCGGEAPSAEIDTPYASAASSEAESSSTPQPTSSAQPTSSSIAIISSTKEAPASSSTEDAYVVAAAAEVTPAPAAPAVKTEVVYVTEYVNKRHAHGRRHQHFHA